MQLVRRNYTLAVCFWMIASSAYAQNESPREQLLGIWQAESMEAAGQKAPDQAVALVRFTFKEKELIVRGNFSDQREETCDYKLDADKSPKQIQIQPPTEKEPVSGIYRLVDGKLEICFKKASKNPPTEFKSTAENKYVLVKFK
jgi:uncharacterized protein (TIGR03067 family)